MKCKKCKIQIPPGFVSAIEENKCPACGSGMMSDNTYKRIYQVQQQISDLGFPVEMLLGISAALATRFTLVPRDLAGIEPEEEIDAVEIARPKPAAKRISVPGKTGSLSKKEEALRRIYDHHHSQDAEDFDGEELHVQSSDDDLTDEEKQKIIEEYGLERGAHDNMVFTKQSSEVSSSMVEDLASLVSGDLPNDTSELQDNGLMNGTYLAGFYDPKRSALLAKARAAKAANAHLIAHRVER